MAQLALTAEAAETNPGAESKQPFVLPVAKAETLETLQDFRRAVAKGTWETAFKHLDKLAADDSAGLVAGKDGLYLPLDRALADDLAALNPAGQTAYRLFHDAQARLLWEQAQKQSGSAEIQSLRRLATLEMITSVGDLAADRLGEVLFEQGDMSGAVDAWQRILTERPDSSLPRAQLLAKIAVALADAGRGSEIPPVAEQLSGRHAGEMALIAGERVDAAHFVAGLQTRVGRRGGLVTAETSPDLSLPAGNEPAWQFRFEATSARQHPRFRRFNPWMAQDGQNFEMVMPAELLGGSLYANWLGCDFALDLETGKLRWRHGRFHDVEQAMRQGNWMAYDRFAVSTRGDQLWMLTTSPPEQAPGGRGVVMGQGRNVQWLRRDPKDGKELYASRQSAELSQYVPFGSMWTQGNMLYATAHKENQPTELHVLAIKVSTGHLQWDTLLGTYPFVPQQNGLRSTQPTLLLHGTRLYVDSQSGGLVELEAATGKIGWAFLYPSQATENQRRWYGGPVSTTFNPSPPLESAGLLLIKGMQSPRISALSLAGPALAWKRSVPTTGMLAGADNQRIYLAGEEVLAYDRQTQQLAWSNRLPAGTTWIRPWITQNRYYQFTPRGVFELDKQTGNVLRLFRGADLDSAGGAILATSGLLVTVSNRAITAYRLEPQAAATAGSSGR